MWFLIRLLWRTTTLFRNYQPQPVTPLLIWRWLNQFPRRLHWDLLSFLARVQFVSQAETELFLTQGNDEVLSRLNEENLGAQNIIFVALDTAGSSSGVMLNVLRDRNNMERRGSRFIHARDGDLMTKFSNNLGRGAIVYVDDFVGTGRQFLRNRKAIAPFITGNFAEFLVTACICEEALRRVEDIGVVALAGLVHQKCERPLHSDCGILNQAKKDQLVALSVAIHPQAGLGFNQMATMVILARNAPNTTPLLLRGSLRQDPLVGVFPRWDDLAF